MWRPFIVKLALGRFCQSLMVILDVILNRYKNHYSYKI